jgi:ATP-binding cassette, subfamily F, member 2
MSRNLTEKVVADRTISFRFPDCGGIPPPVLQFTEVSFAYPGKSAILFDALAIVTTCHSCPLSLSSAVVLSLGVYLGTTKLLYEKIDIGVDLDSRVAIVGPNGTGKSTLLKLMVGELVPTDGDVSRHHHLRIARYHQHLVEILDMEASPLQFMLDQFPNTLDAKGMRSQIGRFGITGKEQTAPYVVVQRSLHLGRLPSVLKSLHVGLWCM